MLPCSAIVLDASITPDLVACYLRGVISYTVFDPDDASGRTYWWYGDLMIYVHQDGREIDAFELDEAPASPEVVVTAVEEYHLTSRQE